MLTPAQRIRAARLELEQGVADLRGDVERGRAAVARDTADLVDAEEYLRVLALRARRARGHRHLLPPEVEGPRRLAGDLRAADYPRPAPTAPASRPPPSSAPTVSAREIPLDDTLDELSVDEIFDPEATLPSARGPAPSAAREVRVGEALVGSFDPRGAIVAESLVDEATRRSLEVMGLARRPSTEPADSWLTRARKAGRR